MTFPSNIHEMANKGFFVQYIILHFQMTAKQNDKKEENIHKELPQCYIVIYSIDQKLKQKTKRLIEYVLLRQNI